MPSPASRLELAGLGWDGLGSTRLDSTRLGSVPDPSWLRDQSIVRDICDGLPLEGRSLIRIRAGRRRWW
ncbi:MAG: hypothetical protein ABWX56_08480, partial [Mycetocola sp.]